MVALPTVAELLPTVRSGINGRSFRTRTVSVTVPEQPLRTPDPLIFEFGAVAANPQAAHAGSAIAKPPTPIADAANKPTIFFCISLQSIGAPPGHFI